MPALPAMHQGRVALLGDAAHAMTPDLGQGACQALEDAVVLAAVIIPDDPAGTVEHLQRYTDARLPRASAVARRSSRAGSLYHRPMPVRRAAARLMAWIPPRIIAGGLAPVVDWRPPAPARPRGR